MNSKRPHQIQVHCLSKYKFGRQTTLSAVSQLGTNCLQSAAKYDYS